VVLTFVPMHWVHPMRVKRLQGVTLAITAAWSIAAVAAVWYGFPPPLWTQIVLVAAALYVSGLTLERSLRPHWEE
jgi:phosphatidylcholine synthase